MEPESDGIELTGLEQGGASCRPPEYRGQSGGPGPSRDESSANAWVAEACAGAHGQSVAREDKIKPAAGT